MRNLTPQLIPETESDRRRTDDGWYATSNTGEVCSGRIANRAECQAHTKQERTDIDAYHQGAAHNH